MYAMTGKLIAQNEKRDELAVILTQAAALISEFPECRLYVVTEDVSNQTHLHVFEVWKNKQAHDSSLSDDRVRALIAKARPLLAAAPDGAELKIIAGYGI